MVTAIFPSGEQTSRAAVAAAGGQENQVIPITAPIFQQQQRRFMTFLLSIY
jgi:hypothetical protein